ncbi:MAG: UPF0158 family protein [Byssovorax sp.]
MSADRGDELGGGERRARQVLLDMAALERAFEDTTNEARRYLDVSTGTVTLLHHGMTESATFTAFDLDPQQLLIEPVSRRDQYRWMHEFISTLEDLALAASLSEAVVGKGAFARFQSVLAHHPYQKSAWRTFRDACLHAAIADWLVARGILVTAPFATRDHFLELARYRLTALASRLSPRDLDALVEAARFLAAARDMSGRPRVDAAVER